MKKCRYCGADIYDEARFCLCCMSVLEEKTVIKPKKIRPVKPFIAVGAVCLCAVMALIANHTAASYEKKPAPVIAYDSYDERVDTKTDTYEDPIKTYPVEITEAVSVFYDDPETVDLSFAVSEDDIYSETDEDTEEEGEFDSRTEADDGVTVYVTEYEITTAEKTSDHVTAENPAETEAEKETPYTEEAGEKDKPDIKTADDAAAYTTEPEITQSRPQNVSTDITTAEITKENAIKKDPVETETDKETVNTVVTDSKNSSAVKSNDTTAEAKSADTEKTAADTKRQTETTDAAAPESTQKRPAETSRENTSSADTTKATATAKSQTTSEAETTKRPVYTDARDEKETSAEPAEETTEADNIAETTDATTVYVAETDPEPDTEPEPQKTETEETTSETQTESETDGGDALFVRDMYSIQSAQQIHDLMIYEMYANYGDPECKMDRLSASPSYSYNGWEGFPMEKIRGGKAEQYGDPAIYIYNTNEKAAFSCFPETLNDTSDSYMTYLYMYGTLSNALGLCANSSVHGAEYDESDEDMLEMYGEFHQAGRVSHSWDNTRDLPNFKAYEREPGWLGLMAENGLPDNIGNAFRSYHMTSSCHYWTYYVTKGERRIKVVFELREWTSDIDDAAYFDGAMLIEYDE